LRYLEYFSVMKAVDSKLDNVYISILEHHDIEKIICGHQEENNNILLFTPLQLLEMLGEILDRVTSLQQVCSRILTRFHEEVETFVKNKRDEGLQEEDVNQIQSWVNRMTKFLEIRYSQSRKSILFNLLLDVVIICKPIFEMPHFCSHLSQTICTDFSNDVRLSELARSWSSYLPRFSQLDPNLHDQLLNRFKLFLVNVNPEDCFEAFLEEADFLSNDVSDAIFSRALVVFENKNESFFAKKIWNKGKEFLGFGSDSRANNLGRLFSQCIASLKCYNLDFVGAVKVVTEYPATSNLIKFFPKLLEMKLVGSDIVKSTRWIFTQVNTFLEQMKNGRLTVDVFGMLNENARVDRLLSLHEVIQEMETQAPVESFKFRTLLNLRLREMNEFYQTKEAVSCFRSRFNQNEEMMFQLEEMMSQFSIDSDQVPLSSLCEMRTSPNQKIVLKLREITSEQIQIVARHNKMFGSSAVFRQIHEKVARKMNFAADRVEEISSAWETLITAAQEMFRCYEEVVESISVLNTPISQVQLYFDSVHRGGLLQQELKFMEETSMDKGWAKKVGVSIERLFTINKHAEAAKSVKTVAEILGREKTFLVVERILRATQYDKDFENQPLSIINEELINAGNTFASWTPNQINALKSLSKSKNLLKFLKEYIKDRGGLKTFYELATISAGESDLEVDRVSHFYQSVSGYAPLILDLEMKTCSFTDFLKACRALFAAVERDPHIAQKLIDSSNRNLEWIKACKDQQGSVEQSSLTMVTKINQTGEFVICLPDRKLAKQANKTIDQCIKMTYQKVVNEKEPEYKTLPLEELKELRSKLMLITAGSDGKKDVERFVRILGLIEVVATHFIALVSAGCHLFSHWKLKVCVFFYMFIVKKFCL
jgi:hypothetical protein